MQLMARASQLRGNARTNEPRRGCHKRWKRNRRGTEAGTTLFLFPAAFMVMVVLAAMVIDTGYSVSRSRELQTVANSAANDALGAFDVWELRNSGRLTIDQTHARRIVKDTIAGSPLPNAQIVSIQLEGPSPNLQVSVTLRLSFDLIITPAISDLRRQVATRTGIAEIIVG